MRSLGNLLPAGLCAVLLAVGATSLVSATAWLGEPFPGFLVLRNRVVASVGFDRWPATDEGRIYQHEIVAVDGRPLGSAEALREQVASLPVGSPLTYRLRRGDREIERTVETRRFEPADFALLFGTYALNGVALGGTALLLQLRRRRHPGVRGVLPLLWLGAFWGLTAMDLYGPHRWFRLHALCEVLLFPAALHMALCFPRPAQILRQHPGAAAYPYAVAVGLGLVYQTALLDPSAYVTSHLLATSALGLSLLVLLVSQVARYLRPASGEVRRAVAGMAVGAMLALALPVCLTIAETWSGGRAPQNAVGFTAFFLPLSIAYTTLRGKLLEAD